MAIESIGYDTTTTKRVTEIDWAKAIHRIGSSVYGIAGPDDWKVSAVAGQDRTVSISPGSGWGHGVHDTLPEADGNFTLQLDSITSGSRWDLICARRSWQLAGGGPTAFAKVSGSSAKLIPESRLNDPGVQDDQPLALVQVTAGKTEPTAVINLRCWASNGGVVAEDELVRAYLDYPGSRVLIGRTEHRYVPVGNGVFDWVAQHPSQGDVFTIPIANGATLGSVSVTFPTPFPSLPSVTATKATTSGPLSSLRRLQPLIRDVSRTGFTAFIETVDGEGVGASFDVVCRYTAVQAG